MHHRLLDEHPGTDTKAEGGAGGQWQSRPLNQPGEGGLSKQDSVGLEEDGPNAHMPTSSRLHEVTSCPKCTQGPSIGEGLGSRSCTVA